MTLKFKSFCAFHSNELDKAVNEYLKANQVTGEDIKSWRFDFRITRGGPVRAGLNSPSNVGTVIFGVSLLHEVPCEEDELVKRVK